MLYRHFVSAERFLWGSENWK